MAPMFAQALIERGALDTLIAGVVVSFNQVSLMFDDRPWLWVVLIVGLLLLARRGKG